jgi:heme-degrading monooxygenase HmoA
MYAVIFKATINELNNEYFETAAKLRELALTEYGCIEFSSSTQGSKEVAISYWHSKAHIEAWKNVADHQRAQVKGKTHWYRSYQVEIVEIGKDRDPGLVNFGLLMD